jgi:hypothetical protein
MPLHRRRDDRRRYRVVIAACVAAAGLSATGAGVYAGLNAVASNTENITSGTLELTLANNGVGFSQSITNLAPGDVVNRYVDLTNGGTLDASNLTLAVTGGTTLLTTSATKGLTVTVTGCSIAWIPATGICGGTTSPMLASTPVANIGSGTPGTVVAGSLAKGTVWHLQVSLQLPDQNETTTNGTLPANTIQGLSDNVTIQFGESQRAATTTNS